MAPGNDMLCAFREGGMGEGKVTGGEGEGGREVQGRKGRGSGQVYYAVHTLLNSTHIIHGMNLIRMLRSRRNLS
jgi:hypothetical protein